MKIALLSVFILFSCLEAHSCKTLCRKFGDYDACRKMEKGVMDCSVPVPESSGNSVQDSQKLRYLFYTPWKSYGEGVRFRFKVQADPDQFIFTAESHPPGMGDSYFFEYTPSGIKSDHMIDDTFSCQAAYSGELQCGRSIRDARVNYQVANDHFDLWFRYRYLERGQWKHGALHLYNRNGFIYEEYYTNSKRENVSRYRIVRKQRVKL